MSDVLSATPVVSRARSLAAIYVPAHCEPPAEELESSAQLVVGADPKPMVRIVPPSRRTRAAMPADPSKARDPFRQAGGSAPPAKAEP